MESKAALVESMRKVRGVNGKNIRYPDAYA
jgi:hypothetical protein